MQNIQECLELAKDVRDYFSTTERTEADKEWCIKSSNVIKYITDYITKTKQRFLGNNPSISIFQPDENFSLYMKNNPLLFALQFHGLNYEVFSLEEGVYKHEYFVDNIYKDPPKGYPKVINVKVYDIYEGCNQEACIRVIIKHFYDIFVENRKCWDLVECKKTVATMVGCIEEITPITRFPLYNNCITAMHTDSGDITLITKAEYGLSLKDSIDAIYNYMMESIDKKELLKC
jgi:hypothetical protein